jgi:hypothetical protein
MLANQKTETNLYSRTKGINCVAPVRNVITRKSKISKRVKIHNLPYGCVNHLQQKIPPEIEDSLSSTPVPLTPSADLLVNIVEPGIAQPAHDACLDRTYMH